MPKEDFQARDNHISTDEDLCDPGDDGISSDSNSGDTNAYLKQHTTRIEVRWPLRCPQELRVPILQALCRLDQSLILVFATKMKKALMNPGSCLLATLF